MSFTAPPKLDIEPGGEWLLPAAKRWLEQAKKAMRTPLGAKVFDLPTGEKVTVNWRPGQEYIRISGGAVWLCGRMLSGSVASEYLLFKQHGQEVIELPQPVGATSGIANYIAADGSRACGYFIVDRGLLGRVFVGAYWEGENTAEPVVPPTIGTNTPANTYIPIGFFYGYRHARILRANTACDTFLGEVAVSGLVWPSAFLRSKPLLGGFIDLVFLLVWPRAFLWSKFGGFIDLGFLEDVDSTLLAYPTTTNSNWVNAVAMSDDGLRVFGNHRLEHWEFGGFDAEVGAYWELGTGWVRIPPAPGYVEKTAGVADIYINRVSVHAVSTDGNTMAGIMNDVNPSTAQFPALWKYGSGTQLVSAAGLDTLGPIASMNISPSGEFILIIPSTAGKYAIRWSEAGGSVNIPLTTSAAVDDTGRVFGTISDGGIFAASFFNGEVHKHATAEGDSGSEIIAVSSSGAVGASGVAGANWPTPAVLKPTPPQVGYTNSKLTGISGARPRLRSATNFYG